MSNVIDLDARRRRRSQGRITAYADAGVVVVDLSEVRVLEVKLTPEQARVWARRLDMLADTAEAESDAT